MNENPQVVDLRPVNEPQSSSDHWVWLALVVAAGVGLHAYLTMPYPERVRLWSGR